MEWNPVLEERLKTASRAAGWRWIGYFAVILGFVLVGMGFWFYGEFGSPGESPWAYATPGGLMLLVGVLFAGPGEKAAKEARELRIQKAAAASQPTVQLMTRCAGCSNQLGAGARFCPSCGKAATAVATIPA